eukprot:4316883-Amphidinium_carterae.2
MGHPQSGPELVYTGKRFRCFRDGGGLPSLGHYRPGRRPPCQLLYLAATWHQDPTTFPPLVQNAGDLSNFPMMESNPVGSTFSGKSRSIAPDLRDYHRRAT